MTEVDVPEDFGDAPAAPAHEALDDPSTDSGELERLLVENEARRAQWEQDTAARYATLSDEERAALARLEPPSAEQLEARWETLLSATLGAAEEQAVRQLLEARGSHPADLHFVGRAVMDADVLHSVDELLATPTGDVTTEKADLYSGTNLNPFPGNPNDPPFLPTSFAGKNANGFFFWRPNTNRRYYVVVPSAAPSWLFDALVLATNDITSALSDDCLAAQFVVIRQGDYNALDDLTKITSSTINVAYSTTACAGRADGCAAAPRTECLAQSPIDCQNRMRFGSFIGFESDYDSPNDDDTAPDLTSSNARAVALHELTHTLGFSHPEYPELNPNNLRPGRARIPTTAEGTVPSVMLPSSSPRFSPTITAEDRQALRKTYSGQCGYQGAFRLLGGTCSAAHEENCLRHGGACEVDAGGTDVCRWAHHKDANSCNNYSFGTWTTAAASVLPGEPGACVAPASSLLGLLSGTTRTEPQDYRGRRCTQDSGRPGVFFRAFSSVFATTYYCSDQKGVWDPDDWASWEFASGRESIEEPQFRESSGNWQMSSGNYTNWANEAQNWTIARGESMTHGCISTRVTTTDNGFSGIIFDYVNDDNYHVFELQPSVRRRIRRVVDGVSVNLSSVSLNYAANWSAGITLMVCYGDGIHTFIDNSNRVSVTNAPDTFDDDRDGNTSEVLPVTIPFARGFGLYNNFNQAGRHAYLRTFPLVHGFSLAQ